MSTDKCPSGGVHEFRVQSETVEVSGRRFVVCCSRCGEVRERWTE